MRTTWVAKRLDRIRASLWFVPTLMSAAAVAAAYAALWMDRGAPGRWLAARGWGYGGGAEGASAVLQTVAGSVMTVGGVVFSITLVALSMAANQFGPRLLRNFMRDKTTQSVLGAFIATFLYAVVVLLAVRRDDADPFVPQLAVTLAVVLALASMLLVVYFIHHVSVSIQADETIARVAAELAERIEALFPERIGESPQEPQAGPPQMPAGFAEGALAVASHEEGYAQRIDPRALMSLAVERDVVLRIEVRPGDYVRRGMPLARVWPPERAGGGVEAALNEAFVLGNQRTPVQDVGFAAQQLVEIAVRALSPGINDPFTAMAAIDRLASMMRRLADRATPSPCRLDREGRLRVVAAAETFADVARRAFGALRPYASPSVLVTLHLLDALESLLQAARRPGDRAVLLEEVEKILGAAGEAGASPDAAALQRRCRSILGRGG